MEEAEEERNLITMLRAEAYDVKDCFTRYSIQCVFFAAIILTIIARFQGEFPEVAYASGVSVLVLIVVTRMGTHKYASVNRLSGYELHLQRTKALGEPSRYEWTREMRKLGWEQAMRAWRVISPTIYDHLYNTPRPFTPQFGSQFHKLRFWMNPKEHLWRLRPDALRNEFRDSTNRWFEPKSLFGGLDASYYPGGYLRTMLHIIYVSKMIALIPLVILPVQLYSRGGATLTLALSIVALLLTTVAIVLNIMQVSARRDVIEHGLLSIHSCAILWQATVIAHYRALRKLPRNKSGAILDYEGYTKNLASQALSLRDRVLDIHMWMAPQETTNANECAQNSMKVAVELSETQLEKLQLEADRLGVLPEQLAAAAISDLLGAPDQEFQPIVDHILCKNEELYRRLS